MILKAAAIDASNRLRCNILFFLGIKDNAKKQGKTFFEFSADKIKLALEPGAMERAHRIGTFPKTKPDLILACGRMRKDTDFAIREDFASAMRLAPAKLLQFFHPQKYGFKLTLDKLPIDKNGYMYDSTTT